MALLGGGVGGAGNPVGGSFTGPAEALELALNYGYGYSGQIDLDNGEKTLLRFTSGNYLFVGQWQMVFDKTAFNTGEALGYTIKLNETTVARLELEAAATTTEAIQRPVAIIIPAYTEVEILADTDGGSIFVTGLLTGEIFRD